MGKFEFLSAENITQTNMPGGGEPKVENDSDDDDDNDVEVLSQPRQSSLIPAPGLLPSYLVVAFGELYEDDGLMVFAKGLGWMSLLAAFCRFYADVEDGHLAVMAEDSNEENETSKLLGSSTIHKRPPLVLVLGLRQVEQEALLSILDSWGTPHHMMPKSITNESGQSKDRLGTLCLQNLVMDT